MKKTLLSVAVFSLLSAPALANNCDLVIESNDMMQFNKKEVQLSKACGQVNVTLKHVGKQPKNVMGHNIVFSKTKDASPVSIAGMSAGLANDYVPKNDPRVLGYSKVIGGGDSTTFTLDMAKFNKDEKYQFFCSFPGHASIMKGNVKVVD